MSELRQLKKNKNEKMSDENTKFINSLFLKNLIEHQYGEFDVQVKKFTIEATSGENKTITRSSMSRVLVK